MVEATSSEELYVEPNFLFDHTQLTRLSVDLSDSDNQALAYARVKVYLVETDGMSEIPSEWSDEMADKAQLISGGLSDANGVFTRIIEFAQHQQSQPLLLIEANAIGIENKKLVTVLDQNTQVSFGLM